MKSRFYTLPLSGSVTGRKTYYQIYRGTGKVGKWQPLSMCWKQSVLYPTEAKLIKAGARVWKPTKQQQRLMKLSA